MSTAMTTPTHDSSAVQPLGYFAAIRAVFGLEMRQRLRGRGWYIMMAVWFVVIGLVFMLSALTTAATGSQGPIAFELVVGFVLFFGLLVAPGLSANAINGDRAAGTLAILQITLLKPGQILWGKWLASWVASLAFLVLSMPFIFWALALGGVNPVESLVSLLMLSIELGLICALGTGISALAARPLFSIVSTYMLVALLTLGTLIAFGLSFTLVEEKNVEVSYSYYMGDASSDELQGMVVDAEGCVTETYQQSVFHTEKTTWLLAANPFVIVADAVPYARSEQTPQRSAQYTSEEEYREPGVMEAISQGVRMAQAGPQYKTTCAESYGFFNDTGDQFPIWPLGLLLQSVLAGVLLWLGRRKLITPVRRLPPGARIA